MWLRGNHLRSLALAVMVMMHLPHVLEGYRYVQEGKLRSIFLALTNINTPLLHPLQQYYPWLIGGEIVRSSHANCARPSCTQINEPVSKVRKTWKQSPLLDHPLLHLQSRPQQCRAMPVASQNTNDLLSAIKNNLSHLYRVLQCVTILLYPHLTLRGGTLNWISFMQFSKTKRKHLQ